MPDSDPNDTTRSHIQLARDSIIGHYPNIEKIGAGEIGEKYLAQDTNLNRQIAIKVLPDMFGGGQERRARFERDAEPLNRYPRTNYLAYAP